MIPPLDPLAVHADPGTPNPALDNRFLLSAIAFLRSKQLKQGAAPRVPFDGHKHTCTAVREVLANLVSWSRA